MIRYGHAGRRNWRYAPDRQNVFRWYARGTTANIVTPHHKRLWHNWLYYGGFYRNVFVWQNKGSGGAGPAAPTFLPLYPDWASGTGVGRMMTRN